MPKQLTRKEFILKSNIVHNNKYSYYKSDYTGNRNKLIIICPIHGDFAQKAKAHMSGNGCPECAIKESRYSNDEFVEKANTKHDGLYSYESTEYIRNNLHVNITCKIHGLFSQVAADHIQGAGCQKCNQENNGWTDSKWEDKGNRSKHFEGFKLYIIRCYSDDESFIKIGKTFRSVHKRYIDKDRMPYEYEILDTIEGSAKYISDLERKMHQDNKDKSYIPRIFFKGFSECFSEISRNVVPIKLVETKNMV